MSTKMEILGYQICEDGKTIWRNNDGQSERMAIYAGQTEWELVHNGPVTKSELISFCNAGNYDYMDTSKTKQDTRTWETSIGFTTELFARKNDDDNYLILHECGEPCTKLLVDNIYPIDSSLSTRYEHPAGIILAHRDVILLNIPIE